MSNNIPLNEPILENIGLYSEESLKINLESIFKELPCAFSVHGRLSEFHQWIKDNHPRLVLIDARFLQVDLNDHDDHEIENLKALLEKLGTVSIILTKSLQEINKWRKSNWPHLHFHHGALNNYSLRSRVSNLLYERLFLENPLVAVMSDQAYTQSHVELILKNYQFRIRSYSAVPSNEKLHALMSEHPDLILWDADAWNKNKEIYKKQLAHSSMTKKFPILLITDRAEEDESSSNQMIINIHKEQSLLKAMLIELSLTRDANLKACRCKNTGLYLPDIFGHLIEREMALAIRSGDEFSIVKICLAGIEHFEKEHGTIFTQGLETNLGVFVKNRVRYSDLVAKGKKGEIWLLLTGVGRQSATLVGERLKHHFKKIASFNNGTEFSPHINYDIHVFPHDVESMEDVWEMLEAEPAADSFLLSAKSL